MLPTSPRALARSMCSSWTTPCSSMATRVSCGVTLMRMSWLMVRATPVPPAYYRQVLRATARAANDCGRARVRSQYLKPYLGQNFGGLEKRQPHHPRIAAVEMADEPRATPLYGISARLVEGLAGR